MDSWLQLVFMAYQLFVFYFIVFFIIRVTKRNKMLMIIQFVKYARIRVFSGPYFPVNLRFCPYTGKYGSLRRNYLSQAIFSDVFIRSSNSNSFSFRSRSNFVILQVRTVLKGQNSKYYGPRITDIQIPQKNLKLILGGRSPMSLSHL